MKFYKHLIKVHVVFQIFSDIFIFNKLRNRALTVERLILHTEGELFFVTDYEGVKGKFLDDPP